MKKSENKLSICAVLMLLLCTLFISSVSAADYVTREPDENAPVVSDNPVLITTQDNSADETPNLVSPRDNSTLTPTDSSDSVNSELGDDLLISTQSTPDYTVYIAAIIALVAVVAASASVLIINRRRK